MNRTLVLVRHGESEWNAKKLFTGWKNPDLTPKGVEEARHAGRQLRERDILFSIGFTSSLKRAQRTLDIILKELGQSNVWTVKDRALNERHYGDLSGLNKDEAREKWGEEQVRLWRRSYDIPPPGGESLKDTVARVVPFYCQHILPPVLRGERVLVAAHGNSLRALAMVLDQLTPDSIPGLELATGVPVIYTLNGGFDRRLQGGGGLRPPPPPTLTCGRGLEKRKAAPRGAASILRNASAGGRLSE